MFLLVQPSDVGLFLKWLKDHNYKVKKKEMDLNNPSMYPAMFPWYDVTYRYEDMFSVFVFRTDDDGIAAHIYLTFTLKEYEIRGYGFVYDKREDLYILEDIWPC